ncbi:MAG TPA: hypothetical protein VFW96_27870 [Thermomicrobiales bacterium]|nr:hypothetical protein [Thermomicrobiales bacterium]
MNEEEHRQLFVSIADYLAAMRPAHPVRPMPAGAFTPVCRCPACGSRLAPDGRARWWARCGVCGWHEESRRVV